MRPPQPHPSLSHLGRWNGVWERGCVLAAASIDTIDTERAEAGANFVKEKVAEVFCNGLVGKGLYRE